MRKIGIVGSGNLGRVVGLNWATSGYDVFFGHRRPEVLERIQELAGDLPIQTGSNEAAVRASDIIFYTLGAVLPSQIAEPGAWAGKVVIDPNNAFSREGLDRPATTSFAERYQADIPLAHMVKALNGHAQETFELAAEQLRQTGAGSFYCGNDADANQTVAELINATGLTAIPSGSLDQALSLEGLAKVLLPVWMARGLYVSLALVSLPPPAHPRFGGRQ